MAKIGQNKSVDEYRVLARKYRPTTFSELIGQEAMIQTLGNAIATGRLAHAFILTGVRGVGKTTTARLIARALNCVGEDGTGDVTVDPCGKCDNCISIGESHNIDIIEMDAASRTGVDDVREIIDSVRYAPASARFKVYIIDEVHMLSKNAFNALLKTLEEPPPHVKFIFATTEIRKLPVTVLSRCQRFDLRRVDQEKLKTHFRMIVENEDCSVDEMALNMISRASEGSVRDGLSLLDQAIAHGGGTVSEKQVQNMLGLADRAKILDLFQNVMAGEIQEALSSLLEQFNLGADPGVVIKDLADVTHWVTRLKVAPNAGTDSLVSEAELNLGRNMTKKLSMASLTRSWQILLKGIGEVQTSPNPMACAEMLIIRLSYASTLPSPIELGEHIKNNSIPQASPSPSSKTRDKTTNIEPSPSLPSEIQNSNEPAAALTSGGEVVALKLDNVAPSTLEPNPNSFEALVELFNQKRQAVIYNYLHDDISLVKFKPGLISFRPTSRIPASLPSQIREYLKDWTGEDWVITIERDGGGETLKEIQDKKDVIFLEEAKKDPLVQKILNTFPDAKIIDIKDQNMKVT